MKVPCGGFDLDESVFNVDKNSKQVKLNTPISYDYMPEGYPKKDGWRIEWDGNTDGLTYIPIGKDFGLYKISDMVLTYDDLLGAEVEFLDHPGDTDTITSDSIEAISDDIVYVISLGIFFARKDNADGGFFTIPEKGVYAPTDATKGKITKENITPISTDFLPKNLNVVFRAATGNVPTSCNVTYDELRGWVTNGIPVLAVFNTGNPAKEVRVLGYINIRDGGIAFKENSDASKQFIYNSDGTFSASSASGPN